MLSPRCVQNFSHPRGLCVPMSLAFTTSTENRFESSVRIGFWRTRRGNKANTSTDGSSRMPIQPTELKTSLHKASGLVGGIPQAVVEKSKSAQIAVISRPMHRPQQRLLSRKAHVASLRPLWTRVWKTFPCVPISSHQKPTSHAIKLFHSGLRHLTGLNWRKNPKILQHRPLSDWLLKIPKFSKQFPEDLIKSLTQLRWR